ncbi:hypothetical protein PspLS_08155 [Pyricularia sp. CBS 133598]|nr:hypothetical protein PspLS_08155 [Pyricularia sp. CBS 133598]
MDPLPQPVLPKFELEAKLRHENSLIMSGVLRDENPLDTSDDFNEFLEACRRGDLARCQELMSAGVNINGKDAFDYTPLIVASGCGHFDLVRLLLEAGAVAERNTFSGERCIYNALNDKIRKLLIQYDYSKSIDPLQPWSSYISSLLTMDRPKTTNISLVRDVSQDCDAAHFELHKFLLAARSPYFGKKLLAMPDIKSWKLAPAIPIESYRIVIRYLYLEELLPRDFAGAGGAGATKEQIFKGIDKVCRSLEVEHLWDTVDSASDRRLARQRYQDEAQRAQAQIEQFYKEHVIGGKIFIDTDKANDVKVQPDNRAFADCLLQVDEPEAAERASIVAKESNGVENSNGSSILVGPVSDGPTNGRAPRRSILYPVHKAMLVRSPYFHTMFTGPFLEAQDSDNLHIIKVDCSPPVLEVVLSFLYTDKADCGLDIALDLLYAADMLLLDRLKTKAAALISSLGSGSKTKEGGKKGTTQDVGGVEVEPINVYDVIRAAWDLNVQRLEEFAARYIAARLESYIDEPEFAEMIQESASRIKNREETDTIELLDDIRYYLSERFRMRFEDAGWEEMMDENANPQADGGVVTEEQVLLDEEKGRKPTESAVPKSEWIRTLDGTFVEDEFEAEEANYQILEGKIDELLDRLKLDA